MGPELSVWGFLGLAVLKILTVLTERGNALLHKAIQLSQAKVGSCGCDLGQII